MASPVQHFWSLSIQGQFFLVWPLLVALVALAARGDAARVRAHLTVATLGVFAASLTFSVVLTATNQPLAYFHSLTRLWEFALGGLLALTIDTVQLPHRARVHLGWVGLAGLLACGAVLRVGIHEGVTREFARPPRVRCWCCWPASPAPAPARTGC